MPSAHWLALVVLISVAACAYTPDRPPDIVGRLEGPQRGYMDGDTLTIAGVRVRMKGIDAPERDTPEGQAATAALARLVEGQAVTCELTGEQTSDRVVGYCFARGRDLQEAMVQSGHAAACPRYSIRYMEAEAGPRSARVGIWTTGYRVPEFCRAR
jgi:endonuclease YncB( thermonuclease family)